MLLTELSKLEVYLNNNDIFETYPPECVPAKLKQPQGKKAKLFKE
jgi:hypothetical protein